MKSLGLIRKLAIGLALALAPAASFAGVFISVGFAPPALPVYTQPLCPGDGYLWNPGYWAYDDEGYYWVPGVWVEPPSVGLLWTPGYWGFNNGAYIFNAGYWGPHVGFYGGINYGFGFGGDGFYGGEWRGGHFAYNTAYSHVNTTEIHNTYINRTVVNNNNFSHTSFNGGNGGVQARPTPQQAQFEHENHIPPTSAQQSHIQAARSVPGNFAKANGGHPAMAALQRPGASNTAVAARGATPMNRTGTPGNFNRNNATPQANNRQASVRQTNGFGTTSQNRPNASNQGRPQMQTRPQQQGFGQQQARPQQEGRPQVEARPQQQARPQAEARPQQQQARPQAQPHAQAAPRAESHPEGHPHR